MRLYKTSIKNFTLEIVYERSGNVKSHGVCEQGLTGVRIRFFGESVAIHTIFHEIHHAVDWFSALAVINGKEAQAQYCGMWGEEVLSEMLRKGWKYGKKKGEGFIFNTDVKVALHPPKKKRV
jgi:hypothetical protein